MKLTIALSCTLLALALTAYDITCAIRGSYEYERTVSSYWSLADKASTINQKSEYIDRFVIALEQQNFNGQYNAYFFPTPDNSFDRNMEALRSLQSRLREIQSMNPSSFEYQTAIQQITQQEQGEAGAMLDVFRGVWWKRHYFLLWSWVGCLNVLLVLILYSAAGILLGFWWESHY